jgi:hypothetical protein
MNPLIFKQKRVCIKAVFGRIEWLVVSEILPRLLSPLLNSNKIGNGG